MLKEYLEEKRKAVAARLESFFDEIGPDLKRIGYWGGPSAARLRAFTLEGKLLRGGLVLLAHEMAGNPRPREALSAAAAMELFQSSFLIHDDIMDRDLVRRGRPAVFQQYAADAERLGMDDSYHIGEALGICAGDLAFFLAFELLGRAADARAAGLVSECARELCYVGAAQMNDVHLGNRPGRAEVEEIIELYRHKTGRYTYSLPFGLGLRLAGARSELLRAMSAFGEELGILFQIKDDELGLYADERELGKPVGGDIAENKKTLHRELLFRAAGVEERRRLDGIFGRRGPAAGEVGFVLELMERYEIRARVAEMLAPLVEQARAALAGLSGVEPGWLALLEELIVYNLSRKK